MTDAMHGPLDAIPIEKCPERRTVLQ